MAAFFIGMAIGMFIVLGIWLVYMRVNNVGEVMVRNEEGGLNIYLSLNREVDELNGDAFVVFNFDHFDHDGIRPVKPEQK